MCLCSKRGSRLSQIILTLMTVMPELSCNDGSFSFVLNSPFSIRSVSRETELFRPARPWNMFLILTRRARNLLRNTAPNLPVSLTRLKQFLILESQWDSLLGRKGVSRVNRSPLFSFFSLSLRLFYHLVFIPSFFLLLILLPFLFLLFFLLYFFIY